MKYKIIPYAILLLLFLSFNTSVQGQGVGLSGKRFSVFYNLDYSGHIIPYISGQYGYYYNELESESLSVTKALFNFRHTLQLEYNLLRNFSVGIFSGYFRDGFGVIKPELFSKNYASFSYGLSFKIFRLKKGALAPLGAYVNVKIFNTYNKVHYKGYSKTFGDDYIINKSSADFLGASVSLGKQGILSKKVLFNIAAEVGFLFRSGDGFSEAGSDYLKQGLLAGSLSGNYLFRLTFGVGICPL